MKDTQTLIKELFSVGAHFGFSRARRHPTVQSYVFTTKEGTDLFDLPRTAELLSDALAYVRELGEQGKTILFVSTKDEVKDLVRTTADAINMPYVTNRWIGGILTNTSEIKKRIQRMITLREQNASGELERKYTKKERVMLMREVEKLEFNFGGIEKMDRSPDAVFFVDPRHEVVGVKEATDAKIPVIAIMSSDCDLSVVYKPIVANDAQRGSVSFLLSEIRAAYEDGRSRFVPKVQKAPERPVRTRTAA